MAWNLETAKVYLEIDPGDASQDDIIQQVMDYTQKSLETLLARELILGRHTVQFQHTPGSGVLILPKPPITEVFTINGGQVPQDMLVHNDVGTIEHCSFACQRTLEVDFEGGFDPLPADLERAMWGAFLAAWAGTDQTTGAPEAGSGVITGSGDVKSLTVFDGFKVDYDVGTTSTSDNSGDDSTDWGWLAPWASTFAQYRFGPAGAGLGIA